MIVSAVPVVFCPADTMTAVVVVAFGVRAGVVAGIRTLPLPMSAQVLYIVLMAVEMAVEMIVVV